MSTSEPHPMLDGLPEAVAPIVRLMSSYPASWALCGGWAVDAWLGRHTREHVDVDIAVFVQDHATLSAHLGGWQLVAHDATVSGLTTAPWHGGALVLPAHIHARIDAGEPLPAEGPLLPEQGFVLDIQLNHRAGDEWLISRDPQIRVPLATAVYPSAGGPPLVAPEVLLFYKAQELRRRDKADFEALLPLLSGEQRAWLHGAVARIGHPWLARLAP